MKSTSKDGLLLEAKLVCNGRLYYLICSIEEGDAFRLGPFRNIEKALKCMTMFMLDRDTYPH